MEIQENLCANELRKVAILITKAVGIGMNPSSYGSAGVNGTNGNVYIWLEDYPFSLFIDLSGDDTIQACWSSFYTDDEETIDASDMTLHDLEAWADALNDKDTDREVDAA
jgi:hypothetical protein